MRTLLRRVFGPSKRELRAELRIAEALAETLKEKAEEGDALLSAEIDRLNDELDALSHKFAPLKFENDRLAGEVESLAARLESASKCARERREECDRLRGEIDTAAASFVRSIEKLVSENKEKYDNAIASWSLDHVALENAMARLVERDATIKSLADQLAAVNVEKTEHEQEADGLNGYFENIDKQISEALEKVGAFPPKPAGCADRVDVICEKLVELHDENARLQASNERMHRMLTEPEFLKAEARKEGERIVTDASMKHWSAKLMVMSFADSIGDAENLVELSIGDHEFGYFLVTIQRRFGKSAVEIIGELKEKIRSLEIALESSAELEKDLRRENAELRHEVANDNLGHCRRARELASVSDDLYVALKDLAEPNSLMTQGQAHAQARYYLKMYAPIPKVASAV